MTQGVIRLWPTARLPIGSTVPLSELFCSDTARSGRVWFRLKVKAGPIDLLKQQSTLRVLRAAERTSLRLAQLIEHLGGLITNSN